ncbi:hypothetical protein [Kordia sp.]|uniref:hypothetical protein n=1 Tax=Kordia sp. TaxID=1965332 RepID=UPI0025C42581|nr:hypothetical protein [Kordia sp.]MCH2193809.1 hypothetical protein [Kordia sp.]
MKFITNKENNSNNSTGTSNDNNSETSILSPENKCITKYTRRIPMHRIKFIGFDFPKTLVIILGFYIFVV